MTERRLWVSIGLLVLGELPTGMDLGEEWRATFNWTHHALGGGRAGHAPCLETLAGVFYSMGNVFMLARC